jgi:hypothetical protein
MQTLDGQLTSGAQISLKFFRMQFNLNPGDINHEKPSYPYSPAAFRWAGRFAVVGWTSEPSWSAGIYRGNHRHLLRQERVARRNDE